MQLIPQNLLVSQHLKFFCFALRKKKHTNQLYLHSFFSFSYWINYIDCVVLLNWRNDPHTCWTILGNCVMCTWKIFSRVQTHDLCDAGAVQCCILFWPSTVSEKSLRIRALFSVIIYNYPPKGRWIVVDIYLDASRLGIYPPLFTSPSGDSCILLH